MPSACQEMLSLRVPTKRFTPYASRCVSARWLDHGEYDPGVPGRTSPIRCWVRTSVSQSCRCHYLADRIHNDVWFVDMDVVIGTLDHAVGSSRRELREFVVHLVPQFPLGGRLIGRQV